METHTEGTAAARLARELGFEVSDWLGLTAGTLLCRARRVADGKRVLFRVLAADPFTSQRVQRFEAEYELFQSLTLPSILRVVTFLGNGARPVIVLEDGPGELLDSFLLEPLLVPRALRLAERLTEALAAFHEAGFIHRDFRPSNVMATEDDGPVYLVDLSHATPRDQLLLGERPESDALAYVSPEHTGRVRHAIDQRSDLYSLGVVLFRLFSGRLPFEALDPLELVHSHLARTPVSLSHVCADVPEIVADIVAKLLAKAPGDRYQSARGVVGDLRHCRVLLERTGRIETFPLATEDSIDRVRAPQKLYGRALELAELRAAYERISAGGRLELVFVSGYSGVGKSSLVHQVEAMVVRDGGFFVSGKFEQGRRDVPYASLAPAFHSLVQRILSGSEQQVQSERQRIQGALGVNGRVLTALIPELELIIGQQPAVEELDVTQAENRLHGLFRRLVAGLARPGCPLVLFFDDLQWLDPASLKLLERLPQHNETPYLLLIGAYRDNEVAASHPLTSALAALRQAGTPILELSVAPISRAHLTELVADSLHSLPENVAPLAELVHQKAAGNPFFSIQFLLSAEEEGLLTFDTSGAGFGWDLTKIRARTLSDDVVALMIGKLRRLPEATQEALHLLSCVGSGAALTTLEIVLGCSDEQVHAVLWKAVVAGLIVRSDGGYRFSHDRVQEAAHGLLPERESSVIHLKIARLLLSRLTRDQIAERVFEVVTQYNHAIALVTDAGERESLIELEYLAGTKAKAQTAYTTARNYLARCIELLPPDAWQSRYEFTFIAYLEAAECESLVGSYERAHGFLDLLLENARGVRDRTKASRLRIRVHQLASRPADAVTVLIHALSELGLTFPESEAEIQAATLAELERVRHNLRGRSIAALSGAPVATDERARAIIGLLDDGLASAYTSRPALFPLLATKAASTSVEFGIEEEGSAYTFIALGVVLVALVGDRALGFEFSAMSLPMNERFERTRGRLRGKLLFHHAAMVNFWCRPFATSLAGMEEALPACIEAGDLVYAGYLTYNAVFFLFEMGAPIERALETAEKYAAFAKQNHSELVHRVLKAEIRFAAALQGTTRSSTSFDGDDFSEREFVAAMNTAAFGVGVAFFYVMKQIAAFVHGDFDSALESARNTQPFLREVTCLAPEAAHHFYYALTLAASYEQATSEQREEYRAALDDELSRHRSWAESCPENFGNRYALIAAEVARIEDRPLDAERGYEDAIRSSKASGFVHNEAIAWELAARFYAARGFDTIAEVYQQNASDCYVRWGATRKVEQLHAKSVSALAARRPAVGHPERTRAVAPVRFEDFDLLSVIKASQAISQQIELHALIEMLMQIVLESAGAQRAVLLLSRNTVLEVAALASVDGQGFHVERRAHEPRAAELPVSILNCVRRTRERVLLSDASLHSPFSGDEYLQRARSKSILCLPILRQAEFVGALYLENELISDAFSHERLAVLELLAGQAAISLENARLYSELKRENAEREQAESALRRNQSLLQAVIDASNALIYVKDVEGKFLLVNRSMAAMLERDIQCVLGLSDHDLFPQEQADAFREVDLQVLSTRAPLELEQSVPSTDGVRSYLSLKAPLVDAQGRVYGLCGISTDITERKRAEGALLRAQEQLRQAQKMEAIGNLAGGVAHDFNNMLSVILSYSSLLALGMPHGDSRKAELREIETAAGRAAELTRQLLAFSRQQMLELRIANLNDVVVGAERFLRRLIGEHIELDVRTSPDTGNVKVDPGQVEQIIMNLAVNARDAMPLGGTLIIETENVELDEGYAAEHLGVTPGPHVMLAVTDTGTGMDETTKSRMFEPFFTTKERGKGTGLGLATVFGIVQQSGGSVWVYSELGRGTTFRIYFPRIDAPKTALQDTPASGPAVGSETVLLVEDEEIVRVLARTILQRAGYHVLEAQSSGDALVICEQHPATIHLLLTDVIMPRMSGSQLSERVRGLRPDIKVLFMSGYTDHAVVQSGVVDPGVAFLPKPITPDTLTRKVREVLDDER
jgi:PAS domain S-box-containing protein